MKRLFTLALAIAVVGSITVDAQRRGRLLRPSVNMVTLTYQGMTRRYLLHVPPAPDGALVLAFHGGSESPQNLEEISGLSALADRERFIVAYPEGIGKSWADGRGTTVADRQGVDDVGFARSVVADIARSHTVDRTRVYATGASNGGIFANRLGCDAADTFAAIAPVIGTMPSAVAPGCHPSAAVAVIGVQGVADPVVPFDGGDVGGTLAGEAAGGRVESSRATQELWRSLEGCPGNLTTVLEPPRVQDGTSVTRRSYDGCRAGAGVVWYEVAGAGHRWYPHESRGLEERMARRALGVSSQNIDASYVIWQFFAGHPRR